jgi:hypothetical protein
MAAEQAHGSRLKSPRDLVGSASPRNPRRSTLGCRHNPMCIELLVNENNRRGVVHIARWQPVRARVRIRRQDRPKPPRIQTNAGIQLVIAVVPHTFQIIEVHASIPFSKDPPGVVAASA